MKRKERPIHWNNLRADDAERLIKCRVKETANVIMSWHANFREDERGSINDLDVYNILKRGHVIKQPQRNKKGDWEAEIQKKVGHRHAAAITIVFKKNNRLKVKTVKWIDEQKR